MKLTFNKIIMHNFFCYDHTELELKDLGYTVVSGINNHKIDGALSNGSGKSSIFNAICYALTGETAQGLKNNVENIYADPNDCWVELDFNVDDDNFIVKRIKTPCSNMKIYLNGIDISGKGIKESSKMLSEYIPDLTSMLVGSIIILGQGLPYRFTNNHPGGRKELLEKLTKSDYMVQSIRDKLDIRQAELKMQLRSHEDQLVADNTQVEVYTKQLNDYKIELEEYDKYMTSENNIESKLMTIKQNINKCLGLIGTLGIDKKNIEDAITEIDKKRNEHISNNVLNNEEVQLIDAQLVNSNNLVTEDKFEIKSLEKEIKRLDSITDICPTCGQKIPNVNKIDTTDLKNTLNKKIELQTLHINNYNELLKNKEDLVAKLTADFNDKLNTLTLQFNEKRDLLKEIEKKISDNNYEYQSLLKEDMKLNNIKDNYDKLISNIDSVNKQLSTVGDDITKINSYINDDNDHLKVIQDLITLTKKEFRGVLLENVIKYMNNKVKQFSQQVFGNDLLSFTLNENYIDIIFDGKYYEALSGGEKQKVDIIIQLALRELLSYNLGLHSNILVLDEIFDNLDAVGCQSVMNLISNLNDIESVFIISHHVSDLQISYDTEIVVEKGDDGISKLNIH